MGLCLVPFPVCLPDCLDAAPWQLRAITDADWPIEQALSGDPEVIRWTMYPPHMDGERSRERIGRARQRAKERISQRYVISQGAGCGVGTAGIAIGTFDLPEVFYALLPQGRGRGAATVAAVALSDWALSLGLAPVLLFTMIGNTTSEAVAARAGFTCAGQDVLDHRGQPSVMRRWTRTQTN